MTNNKVRLGEKGYMKYFDREPEIGFVIEQTAGLMMSSARRKEILREGEIAYHGSGLGIGEQWTPQNIHAMRILRWHPNQRP